VADESVDADEKAHLLNGWMIVAIVAIVALAAIGVTALVVKNSSSSTPSTTKAPSLHTTVTSTTVVAVTTTVPVTTTTSASLTSFVGTWYVHAGQLVIAANGSGTITVAGLATRACSQSAQIQVSPASTITAEATITSIEAPSCQDSPSGFNPSGNGGTNENLGVGATIMLTLEPPGIRTSMGIDYCDPVHAAQSVCGA
jgi:hypothetical protein